MTPALLILTACYAIPLLVFGWRIGPFDYNHLSTYYELAWRFWRTQHGLPQYNPFLCGGRTLAGDPQIPIYHPLTLLVPVLGSTWLLKCEMVAQLALGVWGLRQMLDRFHVGREGKQWATLLYAGGGAVVGRFLVGHVTLGFYFLYPLLIALSYRLEETRGHRRQRGFVAYAALFAYCTLYKPNFLIYGIPPLLLEVALRSALTRQPRIFIEFCAATVIGALIAAVSLLPPAHYFHDFPRPDDGPPTAIPLWTLLANLLLPLKAIPAALYGTRFLQRHEYNVFLGPVALYFAYRGGRAVPAGARAKSYALIGFALFSILLGCGRSGEGFSWWVPYSWFQTLWPGFSSVRVSVRFWYGVSLALIIWSAIGFRWPRARAWRFALTLFGIAPLLLQTAVNLSKTALDAKLSQGSVPAVYPDRIELRHSAPDEPYAQIRLGRAVIECPPNLEIFPAPNLREGDMLALSASAPAQDQEAHWIAWNRIAVRARAQSPGPLRVAMNLNHADYWKFVGHGEIASGHHQPLSVASSDGLIAGELIFLQPEIARALRISGLALACFAAFGCWTFFPRRRRRQLRVGLTGGIASGKSTAAAVLREQGIPVIDMDRIGREITDRRPELLRKITRVFGAAIAPQGKLDRRAMREIVFNDEKKRRRLEAILHPPIRREFERECREAEKTAAPIVVCEAALLVEGGYFRHLDALIVITAPQTVRQTRLQARDNLTAELAEQIFRAQKTDEEKLKVATYAIENDGSRETLAEKIKEVVADLRGQAG